MFKEQDDSPFPMKQPISVLIADPHQVVHKGLAECINLHPNMQVVGWTTNGQRAFELIAQHAPEVVILDVALNELSGIELIRKCLSQPDSLTTKVPKFLVFTAYLDKQYIWSYLAAGAKGYLLKREPMEVVVQGVQALVDEQTILSRSVQTELVKIIASINHGLSERETAVLTLVAKGAQNSEIAEQLQLSIGTIQINLQSIYRKIPLVDDRASAVAWAWINRLVH